MGTRCTSTRSWWKAIALTARSGSVLWQCWAASMSSRRPGSWTDGWVRSPGSVEPWRSSTPRPTAAHHLGPLLRRCEPAAPRLDHTPVHRWVCRWRVRITVWRKLQRLGSPRLAMVWWLCPRMREHGVYGFSSPPGVVSS